MSTPHDALFWQVFSDPRHAAGELRSLLPPAVQRLVDWDTLRLLPGSFKDLEHGDQHADLLFAVDIGFRPALLYLLCEHKSRADRWSPFQVLRYLVRILERFRRENPNAQALPPVIAMVVHHGPKGWRSSVQLIDLFDLDDLTRPALAPLLPDLRVLVDDLPATTPDTLAARPLTPIARLALLALQQIRGTPDLAATLRRLRPAFEAAAAAPDAAELLSAVLCYVARVRDLPAAELLAVLRDALGPDLENAMTSTYDRLLEQGRQEGRVAGRIEGRVEGQREGQARVLITLLTTRFGTLPAALTERIRNADCDQLDRWALRVLTAASLDEVFADD
jgi:predicted transposase YdaD